MKISCPSCEAKYSIGDDKVQSRLAKIRCRKCGVDIVIDGRVQPPTVTVGDATAAPTNSAASADMSEAAPAAAASGGQSYTVDFGESDQRPMSLEEVVSSYNAGYITPETFIWADGMSDWTPLGQVPEIVDALNSASSAPVAPEPQFTAPVSRAPAASTAKAARSQGRGGADLFGAIATAGSEEDMARQAAHEPVAQQTTTGARNESSVLFSLSALTASAKPSSTSASSQGSLSSTSSSTSKEDSGLIDLKALTTQAADTSAASNTVGLMAPSPLGGFGGGVGAPLGGFGGGIGAPLGGGMSQGLPAVSSLGDISYPQKKSRVGLYILGAAGIVAIAIVAGLALQPAEVPPPKVEPAPMVAYKPPPEPEPIKTEAKPPSTGEAAASASAAPPKPVAGKWRAPAKKPGGATNGSGDKSPGSGSGDAAPAPKKPAAGKCGCAAGDLGCAMRCAAKGG